MFRIRPRMPSHWSRWPRSLSSACRRRANPRVHSAGQPRAAPTALNINRGKPAPATIAQSDPLTDVSQSLVGRPWTAKPAVRNLQGASHRSRQSQQLRLRDLDFGGSPRPAEAPGRTKHRGALERVFARTEDGLPSERTTRKPNICFPRVRPLDHHPAVRYTTRSIHTKSSFNQCGGTAMEIDVEKKRSHAMLTVTTPTT